MFDRSLVEKVKNKTNQKDGWETNMYIFPYLFLSVGEFSFNKVLWKSSMNIVCTPKKADLGHK